MNIDTQTIVYRSLGTILKTTFKIVIGISWVVILILGFFIPGISTSIQSIASTAQLLALLASEQHL